MMLIIDVWWTERRLFDMSSFVVHHISANLLGLRGLRTQFTKRRRPSTAFFPDSVAGFVSWRFVNIGTKEKTPC